MTRSILATATLAALVALGGCSSNDDDGTPDTTGNPGGGAGDTSELAEDRELSSEPGGDTSAIAGYWDASGTGPEARANSRFVVIAPNGLETSYELQQEDVGGADCYARSGPTMLVPNGDDVYTPDGSPSYTATRSEDGNTLTVTLQPDLVQTWTLEEGSPDDLTPCSGEEADLAVVGDGAILPGGADSSGPGDSSMFNPDLVGPGPSPEPSGNDTSAIAGLWDASAETRGGGVDRRYVAISADGLWTDYDYRQDALASEGNCYAITPLRLDLEITDGGVSTYSVADGRTFSAAPVAGDTFALTFETEAEGESGAESWPRVTGDTVENLDACSAGE